MKSIDSNWQSLVAGLVALGAVSVALVMLGGGCDTGGNEGDRCNPLVQQDECDDGLHCQAATCSESYCCPTERTSADPRCSAAVGCADPDAEAGPEVDAGAETGSDVASPPALDAGDGG
jgi:hypothetical protein